MAFSREFKKKNSDQVNTKETVADSDEWTYSFTTLRSWLSAKTDRKFNSFNNLGRFPFVRTGRPDHCRTSQFDTEIDFFQEFLLKNHLLWRILFRIWLIWLESFD